MVEVYGIPNCNTVKSAVQYIESKNKKVNFHDFKKESISDQKLGEWFNQFGLEKVVNKKSRVYKGLNEDEKAQLEKRETAPEVLRKYTSIIKRPVIEFNGNLLIGYNSDEINNLLAG